MKNAQPLVIQALNSAQQLAMADLYTFTLADGTILRYTSWDQDITTPTNYLPSSNTFASSTYWSIRLGTGVAGGQSAPDGTLTAKKFIYSGVADPQIGAPIVTAAGAFSGKVLTVSAWAWIDAGGPTEAQLLFYDASIAYVYSTPLITLTTTPTRYSFTFKVSAAASAVTTWYCRLDGPNTPTASTYQYFFGAQVNPGTLQPYTQTDGAAKTGYTFSASGPLLSRSKLRVVLGTQVDTLDVDVSPGPNHMVGALTFLQACVAGAFDGSTLLLERAIMTGNPPVLVGTYVAFSGRVADLTMDRALVRMLVKSDLELLNIKMPRNLYQPSCVQTLFDADCGVNRATYAVSGIVTSGSKTSVFASLLTQGDNYFDQGYVVFTTGALTGYKRTVKSYLGKTLQLLNPLPSAPSSGDTFTVYPGCDKSLGAGGCGKFSNTVHFKGFPFVPVPETTR